MEPMLQDKHTGFSPIHAVVALGLHDMLRFLLDLDDDQEDVNAPRQLNLPMGYNKIPELPKRLTPLQLAVLCRPIPFLFAAASSQHVHNSSHAVKITTAILILTQLDHALRSTLAARRRPRFF